jgi:hypothetical protein
MKPTEIVRRLTGFSTPFGGLTWEAPEAEVAAARRVMRFLEDRRVLYNPSELEVPSHCVQSVLEIRRFLTNEAGRSSGSTLTSQLSAMRAACRKFLDVIVDQEGDRHHHYDMFRSGYQEWVFSQALGELRGVMGVLVAGLAAKYNLDIEGDLAAILPPDPSADPKDDVESLSQRWML